MSQVVDNKTLESVKAAADAFINGGGGSLFGNTLTKGAKINFEFKGKIPDLIFTRHTIGTGENATNYIAVISSEGYRVSLSALLRAGNGLYLEQFSPVDISNENERARATYGLYLWLTEDNRTITVEKITQRKGTRADGTTFKTNVYKFK